MSAFEVFHGRIWRPGTGFISDLRRESMDLPWGYKPPQSNTHLFVFSCRRERLLLQKGEGARWWEGRG